MKNRSKFALEVVITLIVASLVSSAVAILTGLVIMNLGGKTESLSYVNTLASCLWGVVVGYKLNSLIRQHQA
jgi:hypothetical protein